MGDTKEISMANGITKDMTVSLQRLSDVNGDILKCAGIMSNNIDILQELEKTLTKYMDEDGYKEYWEVISKSLDTIDYQIKMLSTVAKQLLR